MSEIYVVLIVCLLIWGGIFFYLLHLDKQISKLRQKLIFREENNKS